MTDTNDIATLIPQADVLLERGFNVLLIGPHGTGKTQSLLDLCRAKGVKFKYYSCSTLDPYTDLVGVPVPMRFCTACDKHYEQAVLTCPTCQASTTESLKMVRPHDVDDAELIFFDEFNRADSKTLNAIFEIIQFGSINGEPLRNLKACWAAMNPPDEGYMVEEVDAALMDRFDVYIDVLPRPSISYMAQFVSEPVARALKMWWDDHGRTKAKQTDKEKARMEYVSPRRLLKIGLVWEATKNSRTVKNALPPGGQFDTNKLIELLKAAEGKAGQKTKPNIGDAAADFTYNHAGLLSEKKRVIEFLKDNPMALETHQKVASTLENGVGGTTLGEIFAEVLDALNPAVLESFVTNLPDVKRSQMRMGFKALHKKNASKAESLKNLYGVLSQGARGADWITI